MRLEIACRADQATPSAVEADRDFWHSDHRGGKVAQTWLTDVAGAMRSSDAGRKLMKRVFLLDVLRCPCGGSRRGVSFPQPASHFREPRPVLE